MFKHCVLTLLAFLSCLGTLGAQNSFTSDEDLKKLEAQTRAKLLNNPNSIQALETLARTLYFQDRYKEGLKLLERAYQLDPSQSRAVELARYSKNSSLNEKAAKWALEALAFPEVSFHALELFDRALDVQPDLASLSDDRIQRARRHKGKWDAMLAGLDKRLPTFRATYRRSESDRVWPPSNLKIELNGGQLVAHSPDQKRLWSVPWDKVLVKVITQKERVIVVAKEQVYFLDPKTGKTVDSWPRRLVLNVGGYDSTISEYLWDRPGLFLGADQSKVYLDAGNWLVVLRQSDAGGWAHYFGYSITAKRSADAELLVIENYHNSIKVFRLHDGKKLWSYSYDFQLDHQLLDISDTEISVYLPDIGRLITLSRSTGKVLRELRHQDYY